MASPILKWAGGKRQLLDRLEPFVPPVFGRYFEPFVGGGALFFRLQETGRIRHGATLSDVNRNLIDCYHGVRDRVEDVIKHLHTYKYEEEGFYRVRALVPEALPMYERAARFIYINKCGFNGLYRENKKGECNVPFGDYTNPTICDEPRLRAASVALQGAAIFAGGFNKALRVNAGDFVYLDPPYVPVTATSNFTAYSKDGFGPDDQLRLCETFKVLVQMGVHVLLTNSDTPLVREMYAGFEMHRVEATRRVNSKGGRRGTVGELIIVGREVKEQEPETL